MNDKSQNQEGFWEDKIEQNNQGENEKDGKSVYDKIMSSKIVGAIIGIGAVVAQVVHVFVKNVFFGDNEHYNLGKVFREAQGPYNLIEKSKGKTEKTTISEDVDKSKDDKNKNKDNQNKGKEENSWNKENREFLKDIISKKENEPIMDEMVSNILNNKEVKELFESENMHLGAVPKTDKVCVFFSDKEIEMSKTPYINKKDLLLGDTKNLATAIYQQQPEKRTIEDETRSHIKAALMQAKCRSIAFKESIEASNNKESINLVNTKFYSKNENIVDLKLHPSKENKNEFEVEVNGKKLGSVNIDLSKSSSLDVIATALEQSISESVQKGIKENVEVVTRENDNPIFVECLDKNKKIWNFEIPGGENIHIDLSTEKGLKDLKEFFVNSGMDEKKAEAYSLYLCATANPRIKPELDKVDSKNSLRLNPFTGKVLENGDVFLDNTKFPPTIKQYNLVPEKDSRVIEKNKFIVAIKPYSSLSYCDVENEVNKIVKTLQEPEKNKELMQMPRQNQDFSYKNPLESQKIINGKFAFKELNKEFHEAFCIEGKDIPKFKFKDLEMERNNETSKNRNEQENEKSSKKEQRKNNSEPTR